MGFVRSARPEGTAKRKSTRFCLAVSGGSRRPRVSLTKGTRNRMKQKNKTTLPQRLLTLLLCALLLCGALPGVSADAPDNGPAILAGDRSYEEFQADILARLDEIHYQAEAELTIDARPFTKFSPELTDALAHKRRVTVHVTYTDADGSQQVLTTPSVYALLLAEEDGSIDFDKARKKLPDMPELPYEVPPEVAQRIDGRVDPKKIRFIQAKISNVTGEYTVLGNAEAIRNGTLDPDSLPVIRIFQDDDGELWTLDHRRLAAMKIAGVKEVNYRWATPEEVALQWWKDATTTRGESILLKMEDGTYRTVYRDGRVSENADQAPSLTWAQYMFLADTASVYRKTDCTRADVITALWKLAASPDGSGAIPAFSDVKTTDAWYDAVCWAVETGITDGAEDGLFQPAADCSRAQFVTMLYRFTGSPKEETRATISDVSADSWYADAVNWAADERLMGISEDFNFYPDESFTYADGLEYLYQLIEENDVLPRYYSEDAAAERMARHCLAWAEQEEPAVTALLQSEEGDHAQLSGLDFRFKSVESLARKLKHYSHKNGSSLLDNARVNADTLRYTMLIDSENYVETGTSLLDSFTNNGYIVTRFSNTWDNELYKGINLNLQTASGLIFELQLHTPESFDAKMRTHEYYEIVRADDSTKEQTAEAIAAQQEIVGAVTIPSGALEFTYATTPVLPVVIPVSQLAAPAETVAENPGTGKKIGILGGTYDPIHDGHVELGQSAYEQLGLDEVWFMPNANPPHKQDRNVTDAEDRCAMVELALQDYPYMKLCRYEVDNNDGGLTLTTFTLGELHKLYPEDQLYFIMGSDTMYHMENWTGLDTMLESCTLAVVQRLNQEEGERGFDEQAEYLRQTYGARIVTLTHADRGLSSTLIRSKLANGESLEGIVAKPVEDYIWEHGLYGTAEPALAA